jgi:ABC-type multidrug transport system fused ATPase/permease subunit
VQSMRPNNFASKAERTTSVRNANRARDTDPPTKPKLADAWPHVWRLIRPRRRLLAVGFVLMIINRFCGLALPAASKPFVDSVLTHHKGDLLLPIIGFVLGATVIQATTSFALTQLLSKAAQRMIAELRQQVQAHIGRLSVSFYDANRTGNLVSRIMTDVEGVRNLMGTGLVDFVGGIITAVIAFVALLRISSQVTLTIFGLIVIFTAVLQKAFRVMRPIFRERGKINAEVTGRLTESLGGVRVVKGYHAEGREASVFSGGVQRLLDNVMRSMTLTSVLSMASTGVVGVMGSLVMLTMGHQALANHVTAGDYVKYVMFLTFMVAPIFQVVNIGTQLSEAIAGLDRTAEILSEQQEYDQPARVIDLPPVAGDLRFNEVRFAYEPDKPVLRGISFHAEPGSVTALVGSSGSGKSTIISLVCAFHAPDSGSILVDGVDLSTVKLDSYRSQLGVVLQESFLFDGTIRENVMFSRPDATEEQLLRACRIARVDEFAERFPDGYDTIVGERGVKLSGGQRQRLSIARAILAEPRILILDEATSSLDSESEAMIQHGLSFLMQGRTTFVIAHRLSTIRRADQILVVEAGEILEHGTHETLFALGGRYYDLYMRQHGLDANRFLAPGEGDAVMEPA